jgi:hypothetical protein
VYGLAFQQGAADNRAASWANRVIPDVLYPVRVGVAARCEMKGISVQFVNKGEVGVAEMSGSLGDGVEHRP